MNAQTIINAALETSVYYRVVKQDDKMADAFRMFAQAISEQEWKEAFQHEQSHRCAMEEAIGQHCQG